MPPLPTSPSAVDARARRVVPFVFVTVFLDLAGFGIVIPLLPLYVESMHGSAETVGLILSLFAFTQLVATPFMGRLSDRVGRRPVILLSLAGNAASMVLFALATKTATLWLLFASRMVAGATAGNISTCQAAIADVTTGEDRAAGMGRLGAGIGLGMVLGPVLGSSLSHIGGWAPPLAAAALALVDLVAAALFMPETKSASRASQAPRAAHPVAGAERPSMRALGLVLVITFFTFLYLSIMQVVIPLFAKARLGWDEKAIGYAFGLFGFLSLVVQLGLIGRLTRRLGAVGVVLGGSLVSAAGLVILAFSHDQVRFLAGVTLMGLGLGTVNPCLSTLASEYAGRARQGAVLGFAQSAGGLARTVGPVWNGILYARIGPGAPFAGGAIAAVVSAALAAVLGGIRRAARAPE